MSDDNELLFRTWSDAADKFDYYVTGFTAATVTYLIEKLTPIQVIDLNVPSVEFVGLVMMLLSLLAGVIRIERGVTVHRISYDIFKRESRLPANRPLTYKDDSGRALSAEENEAL